MDNELLRVRYPCIDHAEKKFRPCFAEERRLELSSHCFFTISRLLGMCEFRTIIVEKQNVFLGGIVVVVSKSTVCRSSL
jgi:hypothetical protein